ncbi:hypothetical protein DIS07_09925 [Polaribacter aquimarinus]|uniref:Uncharacterized protein n=1 Tax=Polaribacter aquimarinus TaxID=2100726 RepID=A0A2U2J8W5_9FLAO|nr:hypothetical protein DIS07_09925 [Polaribacter aquimarinus]
MKTFFNINVDYIYFDLNVSLVCNITAVFFLLIGFNYYSLIWVQKTPKKTLTIIHIVLQLLTLIPFITLVFSIDSKDSSSLQFLNNNFILIISFLIFIVSIFVHLINFFSSLFSKSE